jgi:hypothetical protein
MELPRTIVQWIDTYVAEALVETGTRRPTQDDVDEADTVVAPLPRRRAPQSTADVTDEEVTREIFRRPLTADL